MSTSSPSFIPPYRQNLSPLLGLTPAAKTVGTYNRVIKAVYNLEVTQSTAEMHQSLLILISAVTDIGFIRQSDLTRLKNILKKSIFERSTGTFDAWQKVMAWDQYKINPNAKEANIPAFHNLDMSLRLSSVTAEPPKARSEIVEEVKQKLDQKDIPASILYDMFLLKNDSQNAFKYLNKDDHEVDTLFSLKYVAVSKTRHADTFLKIMKEKSLLQEPSITKLSSQRKKTIKLEKLNEKEQTSWKGYMKLKVISKVLRAISYVIAPTTVETAYQVVATVSSATAIASDSAQGSQGILQRLLKKAQDAKMTVARSLSNFFGDVLFVAFVFVGGKILSGLYAGFFIVADTLGIIKLSQDIVKNAKEIKSLVAAGKSTSVKGDRLWFLRRDNRGQAIGIAARVASIVANTLIIGMTFTVGFGGAAGLVGTPPGQAILGFVGISTLLYMLWAWIRLDAKNTHVNYTQSLTLLPSDGPS